MSELDAVERKLLEDVHSMLSEMRKFAAPTQDFPERGAFHRINDLHGRMGETREAEDRVLKKYGQP